MSFFDALILSMALCVDSLVVSATTAFRNRMGWRQGVLMALIFGFCQGLFPMLGALIGDVARSFIEAVDHWVAFGLLAIIGGKMIFDGIKDGTESGERKTENDATQGAAARSPLATYFLLGIATSIDAFAVGIGLGLQEHLLVVLYIVSLIGLVTFMVSLLGVYLGKRNVPIPERTANIVAGVVLVGLGVKILVEHLLIG